MAKKKNADLLDGLDTRPLDKVAPVKKARAKKAAPASVSAPSAPRGKAPQLVEVNGMTFDLNKRYRIEIDEAEGQPNYETVSVNGVAYQIQRGKATSVPAPVAIGLCRAIAARLVKVGENNGKPEYELRDYHAIPFRIMGEG